MRQLTTMVLLCSLYLGGVGVQSVQSNQVPTSHLPLLTRWGRKVDERRARFDYPRPNAVRRDWKPLNGPWEFAFDPNNIGLSKAWYSTHILSERIVVPWTYETRLSGIQAGPPVCDRVWYRRVFDVPHSWSGKHIILHFGAVDWQATVWVNGHELGSHTGGYTGFSFDITSVLRRTGPQEIVLSVHDPCDPSQDGYQPRGKQLGSHGVWYTRSTGIWQSVWLEPVDACHVEGFTLTTDLESRRVTISARTKEAHLCRLRVEVSWGDRRFVSTSSVIDEERTDVSLVLPSVQPWRPECPTLYDVTIELLRGKRLKDRLRSYCAFRSVAIRDGHVVLNGVPIFLRGVLDQGYWPEGGYTAPSDDAIRNDVVMAKRFGFNLVRKHQKIDEPRWYYYCDKLGLLVAQDMPASYNLGSADARRQFLDEWKTVIASLSGHASVIIWIPFNENWGNPGDFQDDVVKTTRLTDPSRLLIDSSGWYQHGNTDLIDIHEYGNNLLKHSHTGSGRAWWFGEFGGLSLPVPGHTWYGVWRVGPVSTASDLLGQYRSLLRQIARMDEPTGFVYTQLCDVEQELNGLMTYDRLPKIAPASLAVINRDLR